MNIKNKIILGVFIFLSICSSNCFAKFSQDIVEGKTVVKFSSGDLVLPGEIFDHPVELDIIDKALTDRSSPVHALQAMYSSNKVGDPQWIMEGFVENEREMMRGLVTDPQILKKNTDYFALTTQMNVVGYVDYGEYKIYFLQQVFKEASHVLPVTLINVNGEWLRTNALKADKTFDVIFSSLS